MFFSNFFFKKILELCSHLHFNRFNSAVSFSKEHKIQKGKCSYPVRKQFRMEKFKKIIKFEMSITSSHPIADKYVKRAD